MKYKAKSHNLKAHFNTEYAQKVGLCNLQLDGEVGLVPLGKCSSSAMTTQEAMMVTNTVHSNGGHSIMNFVSLRMMLVSLRRNREEGPSWPSFCPTLWSIMCCKAL